MADVSPDPRGMPAAPGEDPLGSRPPRAPHSRDTPARELAAAHRERADAAERVAEVLQRSLLPDTLPRPPELELAGRYVPAGGEFRVGGDWYDAVTLEDGRVVLAIGDVAGHGIRAATVMGRVSHALRAYALEGHPPAALMRRLDILVLRAELEMVTCVCAILDPADGALTWASAGHPPPLAVGPDGARLLEGPVAHPLGVLVGNVHHEGKARLGDREALVLYTDGLVERRGSSIDVGIDLLADALAAAAGDLPDAPADRSAGGAVALCDAALAALLDGHQPADDVALLIARRARLTAPHAELTLPAHQRVLRDVREWLQAWLRSNQLSGRRGRDLVLAVHEACMNAVEHAYGSGVGNLYVKIDRSERNVTLEVRDEGTWRAPRLATRDRGRGVALMGMLVDDVTTERGPAGSVVRMRTEIPEP